MLENLALRQQINVLQRGVKKPVIRVKDRLFWIALRRLWGRWGEAVAIVKPETVIRWHRKGFCAYWSRKGRPGSGRPRVNRELQALIRNMAAANQLWGVPGIHGE